MFALAWREADNGWGTTADTLCIEDVCQFTSFFFSRVRRRRRRRCHWSRRGRAQQKLSLEDHCGVMNMLRASRQLLHETKGFRKTGRPVSGGWRRVSARHSTVHGSEGHTQWHRTKVLDGVSHMAPGTKSQPQSHARTHVPAREVQTRCGIEQSQTTCSKVWQGHELTHSFIALAARFRYPQINVCSGHPRLTCAA